MFVRNVEFDNRHCDQKKKEKILNYFITKKGNKDTQKQMISEC